MFSLPASPGARHYYAAAKLANLRRMPFKIAETRSERVGDLRPREVPSRCSQPRRVRDAAASRPAHSARYVATSSVSSGIRPPHAIKWDQVRAVGPPDVLRYGGMDKVLHRSRGVLDPVQLIANWSQPPARLWLR